MSAKGKVRAKHKFLQESSDFEDKQAWHRKKYKKVRKIKMKDLVLEPMT
jgi:hypothetical protein